MNLTDPIVSYTFFTDGSQRPVYEDATGQYVIGGDGELIRRIWYIPPEADVPLVIEAPASIKNNSVGL